MGAPRRQKYWCRGGVSNPGLCGWGGGHGGKRLTHDRDDIIVDLLNDFWAGVELLDRRRLEAAAIKQYQSEWDAAQRDRVDAKIEARRWQEEIERKEHAAIMAERRKERRSRRKRPKKGGQVDGE